MDDNQTRRGLDNTDLEQNSGSVRSDQHDETVVQLEHADRVGKGVADVLVADSMLSSAGRDDRLNTHRDKLACGPCFCNPGRHPGEPADPRDASAKESLLVFPVATSSASVSPTTGAGSARGSPP